MMWKYVLTYILLGTYLGSNLPSKPIMSGVVSFLSPMALRFEITSTRCGVGCSVPQTRERGNRIAAAEVAVRWRARVIIAPEICISNERKTTLLYAIFIQIIMLVTNTP